MSAQARIRRKIDLYGEDYTAGGKQYKGIFQLLDSGKARLFFDDTEMAVALKPGYYLITYPDAILTLGSPITRNGTPLYVRKLLTQVFKGKDLAKIAILTPQ